MTESPTSTMDLAAGTAGGEALSTSILQLVSDSMAELAGFGLVRICLARDDGLRNAVVTGTEADKETQLGALTPFEVLTDAERSAVDFGSFRFLSASEPHDPRWRDGDLLYAPLYDDQGVLGGVVALDRPHDGMRPQPHKREIMSRHAQAAALAVRTVLERERLAEEVRLTELARDMVRASAQGGSLVSGLGERAPDVLEALRIDEFGVAVVDGGQTTGAGYGIAGGALPVRPDIAPLVALAAPRLWSEQRATVVGIDHVTNSMTDDVVALMRDHLRRCGYTSSLYAPIGAGTEGFGLVVLLRRAGAPRWTDLEINAALDIGRDLGLVVHNNRALRRERELAAQLRDVDIARSQLVTTVAHELRNPLTSILGYLDLLESGDLGAEDALSATAAIERGAARMQRILGDLTTLSEAGDESADGGLDLVDLGAVVREIVELVDVAATRRGLTITVRTPPEPVTVTGDAHQLDQALLNLVSNAVKYTDPGGRVAVTVRTAGDLAEVVVEDDGIGILPEDGPRLFHEFFRSTNPDALARPGTGLGLVIAQRIIARHLGTITVDSTPGVGTSFVVRLPRAPR